VIQNGAEKRKSRDQGREDIIKSLIIIYIYNICIGVTFLCFATFI